MLTRSMNVWKEALELNKQSQLLGWDDEVLDRSVTIIDKDGNKVTGEITSYSMESILDNLTIEEMEMFIVNKLQNCKERFEKLCEYYDRLVKESASIKREESMLKHNMFEEAKHEAEYRERLRGENK